MAFPITLAEHYEIEARIEALPELIVAVAVRTPQGTITRERPARHGDLWGLLPAGLKWNDPDVTHGFMTSRGRFVDRREAARLVVETRQGSPRVYDGYVPALFSEDMWLDLFELPARSSDAQLSGADVAGSSDAKNRGRRVIPAIDRLRARIEVEGATGCHIWKGSADGEGYGQMTVGTGASRRKARTHRVAYEAAKGPIPAGMVIDHLCRNPQCCNPEHLEAVSHRENMKRGSFGSRTHCTHGHEYTPENTYNDGRGRQCRRCRLDKVRARRAKRALPCRPEGQHSAGGEG